MRVRRCSQVKEDRENEYTVKLCPSVFSDHTSFLCDADREMLSAVSLLLLSWLSFGANHAQRLLRHQPNHTRRDIMSCCNSRAREAFVLCASNHRQRFTGDLGRRLSNGLILQSIIFNAVTRCNLFIASHCFECIGVLRVSSVTIGGRALGVAEHCRPCHSPAAHSIILIASVME